MGHYKLHSLVSRQGRFAASTYLGVTFFLCLHFYTASLVVFLAGFFRKIKGRVRKASLREIPAERVCRFLLLFFFVFTAVRRK